jgi:holo-[acyl-carrier protein] synthase
MNLKTGVDLIEIERIAGIVDRRGQRYLERVYTPAELVLCGGRIESLAVRFAAKEAVAKVLGRGIGDVSWQEIEILHDEHNAPVLFLHGNATQIAARLGLRNWSISLSHSRDHAIAFVVAAG